MTAVTTAAKATKRAKAVITAKVAKRIVVTAAKNRSKTPKPVNLASQSLLMKQKKRNLVTNSSNLAVSATVAVMMINARRSRMSKS